MVASLVQLLCNDEAVPEEVSLEPSLGQLKAPSAHTAPNSSFTTTSWSQKNVLVYINRLLKIFIREDRRYLYCSTE